ncbi:MAG: 2-octaprenylphenol hydroxylase [Rhodocyclaceae bacterium]|nr:2-octaprenylphenol hydroxylase [Rhodocyclaceae bacterium]CAG0944571.1 2-octaprenylphenol hydroxylase [Gammaproteobacteria bacterium]
MPGPPIFRRDLHFDILIVGAGLAGASLAAALRRSPYRIGLIDGRAPGPAPAGWDSRVYAVSPSSQRFLQDLGTWRHLDAARLTPVHDMAIRGDAGGRIDFSAWDSGVDQLAWIVEAGLMQRELWEGLQRQDNLTLFCPAQPQGLEVRRDAVLLRLTSGEMLQANLAVGADGADSWLRAQAGLPADTLDYGEMGVVANFECERPHRNTAFQWFRRDGVLAWLPLPGQRISMVWSTPEAHAGELLGLDADAFGRRVAEAGGRRLGAFAAPAASAAFPLRLVRVPRIVAPRLALIGDAAHAIHPLSGHGINLGFADARALAGVLLSQAATGDCGDERLLRRYARARAEEVALLQWTTHGLQRLFRPAHPAVSLIRNLGLNLADSLPVVRNMLVRYALG